MEQKLLVKVRNRQKIYIHNDLENAALYFKTKVEKRAAQNDRQGVGLEMIAALTMMAFALEARMNFLGFKILADRWDERQPYLTKFERVAKKLNIPVEYGSRPHETVKLLKEFRDTLAHGKPYEIDKEQELIATYKELDRSKLLQAEWQKRFLTEEFVSRAHDDAETIWKTFLQASGLSVFDTITQGDRNIQFISYVD